MSSSVIHNAESHRFEIHHDGEVAVADYVEQDNTWHMTHTWVPPALRGGGLAAQLVKSALETARAQSKKIVPACSYVEAYVRRHPEFQDLVAR